MLQYEYRTGAEGTLGDSTILEDEKRLPRKGIVVLSKSRFCGTYTVEKIERAEWSRENLEEQEQSFKYLFIPRNIWCI